MSREIENTQRFRLWISPSCRPRDQNPHPDGVAARRYHTSIPRRNYDPSGATPNPPLESLVPSHSPIHSWGIFDYRTQPLLLCYQHWSSDTSHLVTALIFPSHVDPVRNRLRRALRRILQYREVPPHRSRRGHGKRGHGMTITYEPFKRNGQLLVEWLETLTPRARPRLPRSLASVAIPENR